MNRLGLWLLLFLAGCQQQSVTEDSERDPATQSYVDPARIAGLQTEATNACLCERKRGKKAQAECWSDFWKEVNELRHSGVASACGPSSSAYVEFEHSNPDAATADMTITTEFGYGACSGDEVAAKKAEYEQQSGMASC